VSLLHVATRFEYDAVAQMREAAECFGNVLQKFISARHL
jgi:hypothetical protein